ncbi:MAG: hypothetical protein PHP62_01040 [Candidatus Moranbacteria bacterium]|nr:hypothetical protein [Candidatus Moranbacteria bacterium]
MGEVRFIPGYNPKANEKVGTGKEDSKFWQNEEAKSLAFAKKKTELEARLVETAKLKKEGNDGSLEQKSFKSLYTKFSSDILFVRKMVAEYNELKNERFREIKGNDIFIESEKIESEISKQINVTDDLQEKSDFDNLNLRLKEIIKNIPKISNSKVVNG